MHIVHVASELAPVAKVGGLADVVYGLSKEQLRQGSFVQIILPKYDSIDYNRLQNLKVHYRDLWSYEGPYRYNNTIWSAEVDGLFVLLIEPHHPRYFFSRGSIYGCSDDIDRFLYFSRAVMEFLFKSGIKPDVIHLHDWQVATCSILYKDMYLALGFSPVFIVFTIHNLEYQGKCSPKNLTQIGLRGEEYLSAVKLQDPQEPHLINLVKGAIIYADVVTTVSPTYREEILIEKNSQGLHQILIQFKDKIVGVLNGIDVDFWNPETDAYLIEKWSSLEEGKRKNKEHLRLLLGLAPSNQPVIACIARLVSQKGPFLIAHAFRHIIEAGAQCVILGSVYTQEMQELFSFLQSAYGSSKQGVVILDYSETLAHAIYAGSDMFLIPSLFEPCGLTQMIALRYGTVPIVRKTGGLQDTIHDVEDGTVPLEDRNGFVFEKPEPEDFCVAIDRAIQLWSNQSKAWSELMHRGRQKDFSWKKAAKEYFDLYKKKLQKK